MVVYEVGTTCSCPREFALLFHSVLCSSPGRESSTVRHPPPPSAACQQSPSKHETLNQRWVDVGPPSATLAQHQPNVGSTSRISCAWTHIPRGNVHFHLWLVIGPVIIADRFLSFIFPVCVDPLNYYQYTGRWPTLLLPTPYITCGSSPACVMNLVCTHFKSI